MKLPVRSKDDREIIDDDDAWICFANTYEDRAEIVQAINSYEKLVKIKQISLEAICTGDQEASDKAVGLIDDFDSSEKE